MYVREQMRNFQKVEKFLKLANFILKCCHFGNIGKHIYFTHEAYGPRGGKQTKWWGKIFSRELPKTSRYLSRIMVVLSFLVIDPIFSPKNGSKTSKIAIFANLGQKSALFCTLPYLSEFFFVREMLIIC